MPEKKKLHPLPPPPEEGPLRADQQESPEPERLTRPEEEVEGDPHLFGHPSQAEGEREED